MPEQKIVYDHGFFFPIGGRVFGGFLCAIACKIMLYGEFTVFSVGFAVACLGCLFFSTKGVEVNLTEKKVRAYTRLLGLKTGKPLPLFNYKFISVIAQTYSRSSTSRGGATTTSNFGTYNILLLNETHHLKLMVDAHTSYEEAMEEARHLSDKLNLPVVKYDPVRTRKPRR